MIFFTECIKLENRRLGDFWTSHRTFFSLMVYGRLIVSFSGVLQGEVKILLILVLFPIFSGGGVVNQTFSQFSYYVGPCCP